MVMCIGFGIILSNTCNFLGGMVNALLGPMLSSKVQHLCEVVMLNERENTEHCVGMTVGG